MWKRVGIGALVVMGAILVVTLCTIWFGSVYGEEFSPDTFTRRRFSYYELPLVRVQVTPIDRISVTNDLEKHLVTKKIITIPKTKIKNPQWDLVSLTSSSEILHEGDAGALCEYLDANDPDGGHYWLKWTKDNAKKAQVLWPEVAKLARQQLYVFIPDLFRAAKSVDNAAQLKEEINRLAARNCSRLARAKQELQQHELAVELYSLALTYLPDDADILEDRGDSLRALGRTKEADADRDKALTLREKARALRAAEPAHSDDAPE